MGGSLRNGVPCPDGSFLFRCVMFRLAFSFRGKQRDYCAYGANDGADDADRDHRLPLLPSGFPQKPGSSKCQAEHWHACWIAKEERANAKDDRQNSISDIHSSLPTSALLLNHNLWKTMAFSVQTVPPTEVMATSFCQLYCPRKGINRLV